MNINKSSSWTLIISLLFSFGLTYVICCVTVWVNDNYGLFAASITLYMSAWLFRIIGQALNESGDEE